MQQTTPGSDSVSDPTRGRRSDPASELAGDRPRRTRIPPSKADPAVRSLSRLIGGLPGRHAASNRNWWTPLRISLAVTTVTFGLAVLQKAPCMARGWDRQQWLPFQALCYSDIGYLYQERGFAIGNVPYFDTGNYQPLEYPVLTGGFMQLGAAITRLLVGRPAVSGALTAEQAAVQARAAADTFFLVNIVLLFCCALALVAFTVWTARGSPGRAGTDGHGQPLDALYVAAAPSIVATALINWDLFAVAVTAAAMYAWSRGRPVWFGVLLGLGTAAKFYPFLLLGPLLVLCWRQRWMFTWVAATLAAAVSWAAVNAPVFIGARTQWLEFWKFNFKRGGDYGSIWYVFELAGQEIQWVNQISLALFVLMCALIGFLGLAAPRPPRFAQLAFLTVAAFLLVNKVYSPQYVLWLVPLAALARPQLRDWLIWQSGELLYWALVWPHLAGYLQPGAGTPDKVYWAAVVLRIAVTGYLMAVVVRDVLRPEFDPVRQGDVCDDPGGGVLVSPPPRPRHA